MNRLTIPAILAATVLVAGIFAFMPIEQASTVHTTIQASTSQLLSLTASPTPQTGTGDVATWTINQPFEVVSIFATGSGDANLDALALDVTTNLVATADYVEVFNPSQAETAAGYNALMRETNAVTVDIPSTVHGADPSNMDPASFTITLADGKNQPIFGTTTLTITTAASAGDAADVLSLTVIVVTRGDVTAPTAVLS